MPTVAAAVVAVLVSWLVEQGLRSYLDTRLTAAVTLLVFGGVFVATRRWLRELLGE